VTKRSDTVLIKGDDVYNKIAEKRLAIATVLLLRQLTRTIRRSQKGFSDDDKRKRSVLLTKWKEMLILFTLFA